MTCCEDTSVYVAPKVHSEVRTQTAGCLCKEIPLENQYNVDLLGEVVAEVWDPPLVQEGEGS